ncbi:MAG: LacI family DNA-binding transcriptional regulator [Bacilli bacterium]|jgi:LacI family transcriptional regulator|nr:LacI family DNA-binding transcriptional regulator [Bacilli bacterium]
MAKRILLEDIAREVGVTKGLVSRALAGKYNVSEHMRERIVKKAAELGYDHSNLRSRPAPISRVLLVISSRILLKEDYWQPIIKSVTYVLDMNSIILEYFVYDENKIDDQLLEKLSSADCGAFIVIHSNPKIINEELKRAARPIIEVDPKSFHSDGVTQVKFSNYDSIYLATQDLIEKGHRVIAFYGSDMHATSFRERHEGFLASIEAHKEQGVEGVSINFDNTNLDYADDELLVRTLKSKKITALICANDIIALGAYKTIKKMGLSIPDDISVIGFDNIRDGEYVVPRLSTFDVPRERLGREVGNYLIGVFSDRQLQYSQIVVRCVYIPKDSVKKLN